jgi:uncharacterized membrane protein YkoI
MLRPRKRIFGLLMLSCLFLAATPGGTDQHDWNERDSAYELARRAVIRGEALPLQEIRDHLQHVAPGKIVATQYEFEFERWVYEFKIVDPQGQLRKVHIDARSGELVQVSDY